MKKTVIYLSFFMICMGLAHSAMALTVSPARLEIVGDPGTTITGEIEILNEQQGERTFFTSFENFEPNGDSGAPYFIGAKDGLATWIQTKDQVVIESGKRMVVPYSIAIPKDAEPGGYFAAVFFGSQDPSVQGEGQVSVGGKIGVLILLRVSGDIEEGGGLLEFTAKDNQRFFSSVPISFTYKVNNTGGDRIVPRGDVVIRNTLRLKSATLEANKNEGSVLPDSTRKFEAVWGDAKPLNSTTETEDAKPGFFEMVGHQWNNFHIGWYTAKIDLAWGSANQTAQASYNFFVIPWQLSIVIIVVGCIVFYVGRIGLRKYNQFIIAQARKHEKNDE